MPSLNVVTSLFIAILVFTKPVHATEIIERKDLLSLFEKYKVTGAFALYEPAKDQLMLVNPERAKTRMIPASTFKIANSLIVLETGIVKDENEVLPYGGKRQHFKAWEKDMPLTQAFKISNLPIYQELAHKADFETYKTWLKKLEYGNQSLGGDITLFWLKGPLKISAVEQAKFISKLAKSQLPVSERTHQIVRKISKVETKGQRTLYAKTGWTLAPNPDLGWYVGWVDGDNGTYSFALNIDIINKSDVPKRKELARALLSELGIF